MDGNTKSGRDEKGRWVKGVKQQPGPGRPPNHAKTLMQALKERVDPEKAAELLWKRAEKSDQVLIYVFNRIEGMPTQAVEAQHSGGLNISLRWDTGSDDDQRAEV